MKKVLSMTLVMAFCLLTAVTTVNASARWFIGEQFNQNGKTITKEVSRTGNFYNGLRLLEKYTEPPMTIQLKGEKKGLIFWSQVGKVMNVNITGIGALNYQIVDNQYSASGTNNVRLTWKQTTDGHTAADLRY